jgi:hypothetical protein
MDGTHLLLLYGKQDIKFLGKKPRFAKTLSNTSAFTCPRGNAVSALRGNRLYVPSRPLRPTGKLEFWEAAGFRQIWIHNYSLLAKPLYEPQRETLVWGGKKRKPLKKS